MVPLTESSYYYLLILFTFLAIVGLIAGVSHLKEEAGIIGRYSHQFFNIASSRRTNGTLSISLKASPFGNRLVVENVEVCDAETGKFIGSWNSLDVKYDGISLEIEFAMVSEVEKPQNYLVKMHLVQCNAWIFDGTFVEYGARRGNSGTVELQKQ